MDKLWAPWRMEYIRHEKEVDCFLCRILEEDPAHDRENLLLTRGRTCGVVMNRYPYNNGHLLIFPFRHVPDLTSMDADERLEIMDLSATVMDAMQKVMRPDGFNLGMNIGQAAGAGLEDHAHLHVMPRWIGDTNFMPIIADTKVIPQALLDLWDILHPLLAPGTEIG